MTKNANDDKARELLTRNEHISMRRSGTSDVLTVPAHWRRTLQCLKNSPLVFDAHIERDKDSRIFIVFELLNLNNETQPSTTWPKRLIDRLKQSKTEVKE